MKKYRFHPEARGEVRAAAAWYRERSSEAARGFADAMADGTLSIRQHPEAEQQLPLLGMQLDAARGPLLELADLEGQLADVVHEVAARLRPDGPHRHGTAT